MVIKQPRPKYPRRGPSCLLVLFVVFGVAVGIFIITNAEEVRDTIIPTATPEPTRSATEYALLADLSEGDGDPDQAIAYYEQAIEMDSTKPEFYIRLIDLYVRQGRAEEALVTAERATVLAPDNDAVWTVVAGAHIANGDRLLDLGDTSAASLEYAQGVRAAERAVNLNGENATAYAYIAAGLVNQSEPELYERAQLAADTAILLEPDNPIARYYMATVFTNQGFYTAAREQYQLGIQADASLPELHIGLAYNYFATVSTADAILSFQDAIEIDPDNAAAFDGLAHMYLQLGDDALAIENALRSVELNPNVARAHGRLGEAYFRQSNFPESIAALETATRLYGVPNALNARFFNMLANAYIFESTENCSLATPLFDQVLDATTNELIVDSALSGLTQCRQAALETVP